MSDKDFVAIIKTSELVARKLAMVTSGTEELHVSNALQTMPY